MLWPNFTKQAVITIYIHTKASNQLMQFKSEKCHPRIGLCMSKCCHTLPILYTETSLFAALTMAVTCTNLIFLHVPRALSHASWQTVHKLAQPMCLVLQACYKSCGRPDIRFSSLTKSANSVAGQALGLV